jgi:hypothetical protein
LQTLEDLGLKICGPASPWAKGDEESMSKIE